jgi:glycosyltransferase involved in cell wall biosynthesis
LKTVLFINRVYPPSSGATGELLQELAEALVQEGWQVTVLASRPPGTTVRTEVRNGVSLCWAGGLPFTRAAHWRRAVSYLSLYPALWWRALRLPRHDVTVMLTDPPLQFVFGSVLHLFKRTRLVHWAQEVYPEVAECLGVIRPRGFIARCLRSVANAALRCCDRVVVVGGCMRDRLIARGLPADALEIIPNWSRPEKVRPLAPEENAFRQEHQLAGRFVVMYSGNIGLAHTFAETLDAAGRLQSLEPRLLFLFVGDGPRLDWLREETARRQLTNLRFLPPQPRDCLAASLSAADLHLVTMRDDLCGLVVPSKFYGILAAGRPVIFVGPGESEVAREIRREQCGAVLSAATGEALALEMRSWLADPARTAAAGSRARALADRTGLRQATYSFRRLLEQLA